jgi:hypothetical protein
MANALYTLGKQGLLKGTFVLDSDTIKLALISSSYTPNLATHQFYSDVNSFLIGVPTTMSGISVTNGVFNSSAVTFTAVAGGSTVRYFVIYKDTGVVGTSPLLVLIDTTTGVSLPFATNGGDITFTPDSGTNKIFKLT